MGEGGGGTWDWSDRAMLRPPKVCDLFTSFQVPHKDWIAITHGGIVDTSLQEALL